MMRKLTITLIVPMAVILSTHLGAPLYGALVDTFDPPNPSVTLSQGGSSPGPVVLSGGPSGQFLRLTNDSVNIQSNHYAYDLTDTGALPQVDGGFDFRVFSETAYVADGFSMMLLPTSIYGSTGVGPDGYIAAEEPDFSGTFALGFDVYPHDTTNEISAHWNGAQIGSVNFAPASIDLAAGVFHHVDFSLSYVSGGANLNVSLIPDVFGTPGAPAAAFTDYFIAGILPYEYRVQFSGRTGGLNADIDIDNIMVEATNPIPAPGAVILASIGISAIGWLHRRRVL